jgi:hypothetical protein
VKEEWMVLRNPTDSNREGWQCDAANAERGAAWLGRIYAQNQAGVKDMLASQRDFGALGSLFCASFPSPRPPANGLTRLG